MNHQKELSEQQRKDLLSILQVRFEQNMQRHKGLKWPEIQSKLEKQPEKLYSLHVMEETGGEPDVAGYEKATDEYIFYDFSPESPKGRRSLCYDPRALETRKAHKPRHSALGMAAEMGIKILTADQYHDLQRFGKFDTKTSSWVLTPADIRDFGGAIFGDYRYGRIFIYHNGAESYYAARGFRGSLRV